MTQRKLVKKLTHRNERQQAKQVVESEANELHAGERTCLCCGKTQPARTADPMAYMDGDDPCEWCNNGIGYTPEGTNERTQTLRNDNPPR